MLRRLFTAALLGGIAAGFISAALQMGLTQPLLAAAEHLEGAAHGPTHGHGAHSAVLRHGLTFAANIISYCGFGFILAALMEWLKPQATPQDTPQTTMPPLARGVLWGTAGYMCVILAPTLGMPPELPGAHAADIAERQIWWLAAVLCASVSLWLAFLAPFAIVIRTGLAVIIFAAPHLYGAPHADSAATADIPSQWAALFATRSLGISFVAWAVLGSITAIKIYESSE